MTGSLLLMNLSDPHTNSLDHSFDYAGGKDVEYSSLFEWKMFIVGRRKVGKIRISVSRTQKLVS